MKKIPLSMFSMLLLLSLLTAAAAAASRPSEPITGAFGITLGEPFSTAMVSRVLEQNENSYRGPDGVILTGELIRVEPSQRDERFQHYSLKTTDKGIVYEIEADYQMEIDRDRPNQEQAKRSKKIRKTCKTVVKNLAQELETRHGKPRAAGLHGEWFAFRQFSESSDKSISLYANQCRSGKYRVIYRDLTATLGRKNKQQAKPPAQKQ